MEGSERIMKSLAERIAIMESFGLGSRIESSGAITDARSWSREDDPSWDWTHCDYRVVAQASYRPYTKEEFIAELSAGMTHLYEIANHVVVGIDTVDATVGMATGPSLGFKEVFEQYTKLDKTPVGKKE